MITPTALAAAATAVGTAKAAADTCKTVRKGITVLANKLKDRKAKQELLDLVDTVADLGFKINELRDVNADLKEELDRLLREEDLAGVLEDKGQLLYLAKKHGRYFVGYYCKPCFSKGAVHMLRAETNEMIAYTNGGWRCSGCSAWFRDPDNPKEPGAPSFG